MLALDGNEKKLWAILCLPSTLKGLLGSPGIPRVIVRRLSLPTSELFCG